MNTIVTALVGSFLGLSISIPCILLLDFLKKRRNKKRMKKLTACMNKRERRFHQEEGGAE